MKQYVLSKSYELRHLAELLPQGATIRVLGENDTARVGSIVVLTALSMGAGERDLILEVTPAPIKETAPAEEAAPAEEDAADTPSDDNDNKEEEGYW